MSEQKGNGSNLDENEWTVIEIGGKKSATTFVKLASKLEIPYVIVFDYDALMHCETKIIKNGSEFRTSVALYLIEQIYGLTEQHADYLLSLDKKLEEIETQKPNHQKSQKQFWYPSSELTKLKTITNSYNIFVFTKDIEGIIQSSVSKKESKPLKAIERINELISTDNIPEEFNLLEELLKNKIKSGLVYKSNLSIN
ncbi:MAG: hypothetical protein IIA83_07915 [Thaumarchaeota archaeon]|nr:hypothetical protein [Nitrososphaerota archaeon]